MTAATPGQSRIDRRWRAQYPAGSPAAIVPEYDDCLAMFRATVRRGPTRPLVHHLDATFTAAEIDAMSDALAAELIDRGVERGDRVALYLQNGVQFPVAALATWKAGAIVVPINPMLRERELDVLIDDSQPRAIVALNSLLTPATLDVLQNRGVRLIVGSADRAWMEPRHHHLAPDARRPEQALDLATLLAAGSSRRAEPRGGIATDIALLSYTSGTTGAPKGAINRHRNAVFAAQAMREWAGLGEEDVIWGVAPLFHITGSILHLCLSLLTGCPLVLTHRFDPPTAMAMIAQHRATFSVGAITAFIALLNEASGSAEDLRSLTRVYSGGAPVPAAIVDAYEKRFGAYIRVAYGLTETTSPAVVCPRHVRGRTDPSSGTLSVGVPIFDTDARVVGDDGSDLPPGEAGELALRGPQVVDGYWNKPDETAHAIRDGWLMTGDVAIMDDDGFVYIVDRKKDMIIASGFKVWPREVEECLYGHPAVREAAVVGVPDAYRGETVKAFVSLREGQEATPDELIAFARERLAAYKYPRAVEILDEIPKTVSGKLLRRDLRERASSDQAR